MLIEKIDAFNKGLIDKAAKFLGCHGIRKLVADHERVRRRRDVDLGFNLFALISDTYQRENFHSDILRALLDPLSPHEAGEVYLRLFIDLLNQHGAKANPTDFNAASVVREEGRLDILVKDEKSRKAIIVENKINGAGDMPRQLPRYLEHVAQAGYVCEAIAYLRLNERQHPNKEGWSDAEKTSVEAKLVFVNAYDETATDLLNGWVRKSEIAAGNGDAKFILRQYGALITNLGKNLMNKPVMQQFYSLMLQGENLQTAQSLKAMLDDLVLFRVQQIVDEFFNDLTPFDRVANWKDEDAYFTGCYWGEAHLGIDVWVTEDSYMFTFWDRNDPQAKKGLARAALKKMKCASDYTEVDGAQKHVSRFEFPGTGGAIFDHIRAFKQQLAALVKSEPQPGGITGAA